MLGNDVRVLTGSRSDMELHVRLFFRRVFLNHVPSKPEKAFWLSLILKPFPLVHQARILFLLYGPSCAGQLHLCTVLNPVIALSRLVKYHFLN